MWGKISNIDVDNFLEIEMLNPRSKDSCYVISVDNDKKVLQTESNAACY